VGGSGNTRWQERPNVQLVIDDANAPPVDMYLRLARLTINNAGATTATADLTPRVSAGVKLGTDVPIQTLRLSNPNLASALWPVFTAGAANRADLTGNLNVSGTANVAGATALAGGLSVTGGATIAGAANLQGGAVVTGNASVSGTANLTGGANVGGVANLNGGALVTGALNVIGNATVSGVANLQSGTVITGAASVSTNLTVGGNATITGPVNGRVIAADGTKLDSHVAIVAGNPHGTLAAQLTDYDYGKRSTVGATFTSSDADGATRTLNVGFQPRFLWFTAGSNVYASGGYYSGGPFSGFADFRGGNLQSGMYFVTYRLGSAPYSSLFAQTIQGALLNHYFYDFTLSPNQNLNLFVTITSVTSTGFVLTLNRSTSSGYNPPPSGFFLSLTMVCVG